MVTSQIIDFGSLLLDLLLLRLEPLLVLDELLLHQQVILDPVQLQQLQAALGVGGHLRQLGGGLGSLHLLPLLSDPGRDWRFVPIGLKDVNNN
jgi:hypothetical protein